MGSQARLAREVGLTPSHSSRLIGGERELRFHHLSKLATALETTSLELISETEKAGEFAASWVQRHQFEQAEKARVNVLNELDQTRAEISAANAKIESLQRECDALILERANLQRELINVKAENMQHIATSIKFKEIAENNRAVAEEYYGA